MDQRGSHLAQAIGCSTRHLAHSLVGTNGVWNVLELLLAKIVEICLNTIPHLPIDIAGKRDASRLAYALEPCRDIHALAHQVIAVYDYVTNTDAHAEEHLCLWLFGIAPGEVVTDG